MGACHRSRRARSRTNRARPWGVHWGLRARPAWARPCARRLAFCLVALGVLLLPAIALSATSAQIFASFAGGKLGGDTAIHFRFAVTESAGGMPAAPVRAIIHLPKGTRLGLARLPQADLCSYDTLVAASFGPSACPKGSHAGPVGSAQLEAIVSGKPTIVKAPVYPFTIELHGGSRALALYLKGPTPFPTEVISLLPEKGDLVMSLGAGEISPGDRSAIIGLSVTLGGSAGITMPASCPTGGFAWRADFSYFEGPGSTALARSPCPSTAAKASSQPTHAPAASTVAHIASAPKSQLECEQKYGLGTSWHRCFSEPPGSSCNHPLELQKAGSTNRGDDRDLHASVSLEAQGEEGIQSWSWKTANSVALCPHGVILKVARFSQSKHCGRVHGEEVCSHEYDTKTIYEPSASRRGSFEYTIRPGWTDYLIVRGYYIRR
jgi:hypothetical protein